MKTKIVLIITILFSQIISAQSDELYHRETNSFRIESIGLRYGTFYDQKDFSATEVNYEITFAYQKHLLRLATNNYTSERTNRFRDLTKLDYRGYTIQYGRSIWRKKRFDWRIFAGVGESRIDRSVRESNDDLDLVSNDKVFNTQLYSSINYNFSKSWALSGFASLDINKEGMIPSLGGGLKWRPVTTAENAPKRFARRKEKDSIIENTTPKYERGTIYFNRIGINLGIGFVSISQNIDSENATELGYTDDSSFNGITGGVHISAGFKKYLLRTALGGQGNLWSPGYSYWELSGGRVFPLNRKEYIEIFAGYAYTTYSEGDTLFEDRNGESSVSSFPLRVQYIYNLGSVDLGLGYRIGFDSIATSHNFQLIFGF